MSSDHKIRISGVFKDLDEIFKLRTKSKRANVSYGKGSDDLSNRYEKSESSADQITYDTNFKLNGTDFRYLFKDKNFVDVVIPTYEIASVGTSVSEGSAITFNVVTTNVANGTQFTWAASRNDLSPKSGTVTIQNNKATFNVTAIADSTTEGNQTFKIDLKSTSAGTPTVASSNDVTIIDSSTTPAPVNYNIGLRVDVYRNTSAGNGNFKDNGHVRVLIKRDSILKYGSDGKCNVTVRVSNSKLDSDGDGINTVASLFGGSRTYNWNFTLKITRNELLNSVPNTVTGRANDAGYYDITGALPTPSSAGWSASLGIPWYSTTTVTITDTLAGTTKSGTVSPHFNGHTDQAYPKYF